MNDPAIQLLLIEDDPIDALFVEKTLGHTNPTPFRLTHVKTLSEGLELLHQSSFAAIVLALNLPDSQGLATLVKIREQTPRTPIVVIAAAADETVLEQAEQHGAQEYLVKGQVERDGLLRAVRYAIERKRAEDEIQQLKHTIEQLGIDHTQQMETADKELTTFASVVAHDLRAPLRAITGYAQILAEDSAQTLDQEGQRLCAIISDESERMGQLIDALLAFSRFSRTPLRRTAINMEQLASHTFKELTQTEDRKRFDFRLDALPAAVGDIGLIEQVWANLLSNAVKFSSKQPQTIIQIRARQTEGETMYCVQDNGAGFDMQYAPKLFGVFQRLHSDNAFTGMGAGLAIAHRIIERHGGRIWAESSEGQGTTFWFSLPILGATDARP